MVSLSGRAGIGRNILKNTKINIRLFTAAAAASGRRGGFAYQAVLAQPAGSVTGQIRITRSRAK